MKWITEGYDGFTKGSLGNGGQNLYVSAKGVLQRIFQFDVNGDGYPDLLFANSQSMGERPPVYLYERPFSCGDFAKLPSGGSYAAVLQDLNGDGYDDLVIACQNNGTHSDITAFLYYGSPEGLSERYRAELPAPDAIGVAAGDFDGDGRTDLVFLSGAGLRFFYQTGLGFEASEYVDLPLLAQAVAAGDIDGDGVCDLYVRLQDGSGVVFWGGEGGIDLNRRTVVYGEGEPQAAEKTTTPGRRPAYRGVRPSVLKLDGRTLLFTAQDGEAVFYESEGRSLRRAFSLKAENAVAAACGDLDGDGLSDIAVVCCKSIDSTEASYIYWNRGGCFSDSERTAFESVSGRDVRIASLAGDGKNQLLLCQGGTSVLHSTKSLILDYTNRTPRVLRELESGDAAAVLAGHTRDGEGMQVAVVNHETGRVRGDENVVIYLGGPDGYSPDRKLCLPGWAAVDGLMFDYDDDGLVDVLVSNCAENAPHLDPGSFLYYNGPEGLCPENRVAIPSVRGHGAAVGDFDRDGYLDIAIGGFMNREIRIFRGGPDGFDTENPIKIVMGPDKDYTPPVADDPARLSELFASVGANKEFGEIRWLFAADFNGDGWLDLFVSEIVGPRCFILWGGPEGYSTDRMQALASGGVASAKAADLDGDGYLDLILGGHMCPGKSDAGKYESYITIYWGGPEGYQEHRKTMLPASCANAVTVGDFNGDGNLDIYGSAYNSGRNRDIVSTVYYGGENGGYSLLNTGLLFNHSGSGCLAGDFNGDGYADLAVACHKGNGDHCSESFVFWGGPDGLSDDRKTVLPTVGPHGMSAVDMGNVMDRGPEEQYVSAVYENPGRLTVRTARWDADIPASCWVSMQLRGADTAEGLDSAPWSEAFASGAELSGLGFSAPYLQYRLLLGAKASCGTPRVRSVTVELA